MSNTLSLQTEIYLTKSFEQAVEYHERQEDSKARDLFFQIFNHINTPLYMRANSALYLANMFLIGEHGVEKNWLEAMRICNQCDKEFLNKQQVDETIESKIHMIMAHIFNYGCSAIPKNAKSAMIYFEKVIRNCKNNKIIAEDAKLSKAAILVNYRMQKDKIKFKEAEDLIDQVLQKPIKRELDAKFMKALILSQAKRFQEAYKIYESIIYSKSTETFEKTRAEVNLAELILNTNCFQNRLEIAKSLLENVTKKTLKTPAIKFLKGVAHRILGNIPQALSFLFCAYIEGDRIIEIQSESYIYTLYLNKDLKEIIEPYLLLIQEVKNQVITKGIKWKADSINGNSEVTDLLKALLLLDEDCQGMVQLKINILIYLTSNKYDFSSISSNQQDILDALGRLCLAATNNCSTDNPILQEIENSIDAVNKYFNEDMWK